MNPDARQPLVAVTGASGFVGRHLLRHLQRTGQPALAVSRRGCGGLTGVRDIALTSYANGATLARTFEGVDTVVHLAARAHQDGGGDDSGRLFHEANVETTLHVADAAVRAGVRRVVLVSSIGVNGTRTHGQAFTDADSPRPTELYAISKWKAEQALSGRLAGSATGFVILRPPLVYGPGCPGNFGRLVSMIARWPLVPLGGLHAPRTFIGAENLVDAILLAARHPAVNGHTHLVADGRDLSVAEVVTVLASVLHPGRQVLVTLPAGLLAALARLAGRADTWEKLAAPLQVDAGGFRGATGWVPPVDPIEGLLETARQFAGPRYRRPAR